MVQYFKYWYIYFLFWKKKFFPVCMKMSVKIVCASGNVINMKYMYVCTILIFLNINYVVIEWIIYVKLRYGINFRTSCGQVSN